MQRYLCLKYKEIRVTILRGLHSSAKDAGANGHQYRFVCLDYDYERRWNLLGHLCGVVVELEVDQD